MKTQPSKYLGLLILVGNFCLCCSWANASSSASTIAPPEKGKRKLTLAEQKQIDSIKIADIKRVTDWYRWDMTTNSTLALSRFAGNTSRSLDDDPYMMMIRRYDKLNLDSGYLVGNGTDTLGLAPATRRHNWRLGYNGFAGKSIDALTAATRETQDSRHSLVLGREWRNYLDEDFFIFSGIEIRGFYNLNRATTTTTNDLGMFNETVSHRSEIGGGVDIFGGLGYRINKRLSIYTECNLMFQGSRVERYFDFNQNRTTLESTERFGFRPLVPVALFVSYSF